MTEVNEQLEVVLKAHAENELEFARVQKDIELQAKHIKEIQEEIQKKVKPLVDKAKKKEMRIQNYTLELQRVIMLKHQQEGIIEFLGGTVPEETKIELPQPVPEEELLQDVGSSE